MTWTRRQFLRATSSAGAVPLAVEKPIPYAKAVDMSFVNKARAKYKG